MKHDNEQHRTFCSGFHKFSLGLFIDMRAITHLGVTFEVRVFQQLFKYPCSYVQNDLHVGLK